MPCINFNNKYIPHFLIMLYSAALIDSQLIIPFKIYKSNSNNFIVKNVKKELFTEIEIGVPKARITTIISQNAVGMNVFHNYNFPCDSEYIKENSSSFKVDNDSRLYTGKESESLIYINETISFYKNIYLNETIQVEHLTLSYISKHYEKNNTNLCLVIGLKLSNEPISRNGNILTQLFQLKIIDNQNWFVVYESLFDVKNNIKYDGYLVLGKEPHDLYPNKYDVNSLLKSNARLFLNELTYEIYFDKIYYYNDTKRSFNNKNKNDIEINIDSTSSSYKQVTFDINLGLYRGTFKYKITLLTGFFKKFIKENICKLDLLEKVYNYFYCLKESFTDSDIASFPTLYLSSYSLNYTFELKYKDLFASDDKYVYFLMLFYYNEGPIDDWDIDLKFEFGQIFFKKYLFTYDYDNKLIGFYNADLLKNIDIEDKTVPLRKLIVLLALLFVVVLLCFCFSKRLYNRINYKINVEEMESTFIEKYEGKLSRKELNDFN